MEREALFIAINHEEHFVELLQRLAENGIQGGTILESEGLCQVSAEHLNELNYGYFRSVLNAGRPFNRTILLILSKDRIETAKECVRSVVGDLSDENRGVMFTIPVSGVEGLTK